MGRTDRWDAALTETQRWDIYYEALKHPYSSAFVLWMQKQFGLTTEPSQSAFYYWKAAMRKDYGAHRREELVQARLEIANLAEVRSAPAEMAAALQSLGAEAALSGNLEDAKKLVTMAAQIADGQRQGRKLELQERELKLAQDKFAAAEARLNAASSVVNDKTITPEQRDAKLKELFGLK